MSARSVREFPRFGVTGVQPLRQSPAAIVDDLRSQGFTSVRAIAAQLNERGLLTPRGGAWHPTSAARLLSRLQA
jgi:hypothetical protein